MTKVIFCDFDGVIRHWDNQALFELEEHRGLKKGATFSVAFSAEILIPAITGKTSDEAWRASIKQRLAQTHGIPLAQELVTAWSNSPSTIDSAVFDYFQQALPDHKLALVTNATTRLEHDLKRSNIFDKFDFVLNSSALGFAKPDPAFYRLAIEHTNADITSSIFIDDSPKNVEAAKSSGLTAFRFNSLDNLKAELNRII